MLYNLHIYIYKGIYNMLKHKFKYMKSHLYSVPMQHPRFGYLAIITFANKNSDMDSISNMDQGPIHIYG